MQSKSKSSGPSEPPSEPSQNVSLDVLCRRAERLIESVRVAGDQVERMLARPQQAINEVAQAARSLLEMRKLLDTRLAEVQAAEQSCVSRIQEAQGTIPSINKSAESLIQRVARARELSEAFGQMMESSADKIALLQASADEASKARAAIDHAIGELTRIQKRADNWTGSLSALTDKYADMIASGNAAASRLRTITDAGERLRESVRQDVVALRELLRESRVERIAWEQVLARMSAATQTTPKPQSVQPKQSTSDASDTKSVPVTLANRVRKLADLVRQATGTAAVSSTPQPNRADALNSPKTEGRAIPQTEHSLELQTVE